MDLTEWEGSVAEHYACSHGIPLSIFLGRVPNPGEPYWLPEDRAAAIRWQVAESERCTGCGQRLVDTMGPDQFDKWNAEITGYCDTCRAGHRAAVTNSGSDDLDPNVGARLRYWRDQD